MKLNDEKWRKTNENTCCKDAHIERDVELQERIELGLQNKMELTDSAKC